MNNLPNQTAALALAPTGPQLYQGVVPGAAMLSLVSFAVVASDEPYRIIVPRIYPQELHRADCLGTSAGFTWWRQRLHQGPLRRQGGNRCAVTFLAVFQQQAISQSNRVVFMNEHGQPPTVTIVSNWPMARSSTESSTRRPDQSYPKRHYARHHLIDRDFQG